jgi:hypothetical protein
LYWAILRSGRQGVKVAGGHGRSSTGGFDSSHLGEFLWSGDYLLFSYDSRVVRCIKLRDDKTELKRDNEIKPESAKNVIT